MTEAYSPENPQIAFDLSHIPNLHTLILGCHCHDGIDDITLPLYIRDTLRTINPEAGRMLLIVIEMRLLLTRTEPDDGGYVRMELPAVFQQDAWIQIRELFEALGSKRPLMVVLHVTLQGSFSANSTMNPTRIVPGSVAEARLFSQMIARWAGASLLARAGSRRWRLRVHLHTLDSSQADGSEPESPASSTYDSESDSEA